MLFHDRKGPWAYATSACGYLFALYVSGFFALRWLWHPEWDGPIPGGPLVEWALIASLTLTLHRVIQQVIATTRVYGWKQGLLSIVRHPWATVVNLVATIRAHEQFRRAQRENTTLSWDKTQHFVPQHVLSSDA
jgi:adsorption protein B